MVEKKKEHQKEQQVKKQPVKEEKVSDNPEFKGIVRIAGKDVRGNVPLKRALLRVRGIGSTTSVIISKIINNELKISPDKLSGDLKDEEIESIDKLLFSIHTHNLPSYLMNKQSDFIDGSSKHFIMNDLLFSTKQDLEREKKLYTWKGYRHSYGQKVRGQRTRNTGRTGMAVGVLRKSIIGAAAAAAAPKEGAGAPAKAAPASGGAAAPKAAPAAKAAAPAAKPAEKK
ncbi:MAG: 30S ribosomal protein S13 [Candidatus Micrarchaeota archaeon]